MVAQWGETSPHRGRLMPQGLRGSARSQGVRSTTWRRTSVALLLRYVAEGVADHVEVTRLLRRTE